MTAPSGDDASDTTSANSLIQDEAALFSVRTGEALVESLGTLAHLVELRSRGVRCAILLFGEDRRLLFAATPNLPDAYLRGIWAFELEQAEHSTNPDFIPDVHSDPLWRNLATLARKSGFQSSWGQPIVAENAIGIVAVHCYERRTPDEQDAKTAGSAVRIASTLIESGRAESTLGVNRAEVERQKRMYETILSSTSDLVYVFDLQYGLTFANAAVLRMWGRTSEESVGKHLLEIGYEPWHAEMHEREFDQVLATRQPVRGEVAFPHAALGPRIYDYIFVPVVNSRGEVEAIAGTTRDVTDRKQVEEAFHRSEHRARLAIETARLGTWDYDLHTDLVHMDERMQAIWGEPRQANSIPKQGFISRIHEHDRVRVSTAIAAALDPMSSGRFAIDCRIVRDEGAVRWVLVSGQARFEGEEEKRRPVAFLGTALDITHRKQAEEALKESEERFRAFVTASSDVVYRMSADWNEMYHLEGREFIADTNEPSRTWLEKYIHPDDQRRVIDAINLAIQSKSTFELEHRVLRVDGTLGWTFSRAIPLLDAEGEIVEWFGAASDVTWRKDAEEEAVRLLAEAESARAEAENANQAKSSFLATMSHELRTPLNAIIGYSDLLDAEIAGPLTDGQKQQLDRIDMAARHLLQIIEELLTFSRLEVGREHVHVGHFDVVELVRDASRLIEPLAAAKGLKFSLNASAPIDMESDAGKVRQILLNLLSNAVKFTDEGGVEVDVEEHAGRVLLRVSDTGIGIAPEHELRIFEPFSQLEQAPSRRVEGTGLGLSVTAQLAGLLGGEVVINSLPRKGSTFGVWLPAEWSPRSDDVSPT